MKKIDLYIIRKFLGTFFFSIALIVTIAIVFDISEKLDDFIEKEAPLRAIVFEYYFNFIPYFVNLFSPLFVFISVIFFTSKMATNTEIIAILASGISFKRMLLPYMVSALVLASLSFYLNNFLIPDANQKRLNFEETYIRNPYKNRARNIHRQIGPGVFIYFNQYDVQTNKGYKFSLEKFEGVELKYKLISNYIQWDTLKNNWKIRNYYIRELDDQEESIRKGSVMDTTLNFRPEDFSRRTNTIETMGYSELNDFIDQQKFRGDEEIVYYELEKHKRAAFPFATFILTLIGVSLASRKARGGIGLHIGVGLLISFTYILFMQVSTTFATNAGLLPSIAVWIPNAVYFLLAIYLLRSAPK